MPGGPRRNFCKFCDHANLSENLLVVHLSCPTVNLNIRHANIFLGNFKIEFKSKQKSVEKRIISIQIRKALKEAQVKNFCHTKRVNFNVDLRNYFEELRNTEKILKSLKVGCRL